MEPELDYEPEVEYNADPFVAPSDPHIYSNEHHDNEDGAIRNSQISSNDPISTDKVLEEGIETQQYSPTDKSALDEEFYIGKVDSDVLCKERGDAEGREDVSDVSSDEENRDSRLTRDRETKQGSSERDDEWRKRKSSSAADGAKAAFAEVKVESESYSSKRPRHSDAQETEVVDRKAVEGVAGDDNEAKTGGEQISDEKVSEEAEREMWLKELFQGARFYMIKSRNDHNVQLAKEKNVWSTTPNNEPRLNKAFKTSRNVILLFSVTESQRFAGFARLASESSTDAPMPPWQLPPGMSVRALSGVFQLDWITKEELLFAMTTHLYNEWNLRKPVKIGRDGQEIEPSCGEKLCRLFEFTPSIDIYVIVKRVRAHDKARMAAHRSEEENSSSQTSSSRYDSSYRRGGHGQYSGSSSFGSYRGGGSYQNNRDRRRSRSPYRGGRPRGYNNDYYSRGGGSYRNQDYDEKRSSQAFSGSRDRANQSSSDYHASRSEDPRRRSGEEPGVGNGSVYGDISRETMLHGSYNDYMREFHKQMQMAYPGFPGPFPPPFMGMQFYPPPFAMPPPNIAQMATGSTSTSKNDEIETHAKLVDKFLKNAKHDSDSSVSGSDYEDDEENAAYSDEEAGDSLSDEYSEDDRRHKSSKSSGKRRRSRSRDYSYSRSGYRRASGGADRRRSSSGASEDRFIEYSSRSAQRK